jgi:hypothetical protein
MSVQGITIQIFFFGLLGRYPINGSLKVHLWIVKSLHPNDVASGEWHETLEVLSLMRGVVNILIENLLQNSLLIGNFVAAYNDCVLNLYYLKSLCL